MYEVEQIECWMERAEIHCKDSDEHFEIITDTMVIKAGARIWIDAEEKDSVVISAEGGHKLIIDLSPEGALEIGTI